MKEWFASWFDTPYYHTLYKHRNDEEAEFFIKNLVRHFNFKHDQTILDLACGKGRHSIFLNKLGFTTDGADLSAQSIAHAKQFENNSLHFYEHDMRNPLPKAYDIVLNLFTSFGYFDDTNDNLNVLKSVKESLSDQGIFVIDFLNLNHVRAQLVAEEIKVIDGISFCINRMINDSHIIKSIDFEDKGESHSYQEKVQAIDLETFGKLVKQAGFKLTNVFGNYNLNTFDPESSERLILALTHA